MSTWTEETHVRARRAVEDGDIDGENGWAVAYLDEALDEIARLRAESARRMVWLETEQRAHEQTHAALVDMTERAALEAALNPEEEAMSTQFFKAVRPDGTDFRTGTIDYAAALGGGPITLPTVDDPQCCTGDVLHASTVAAEALIGGTWPCRLFLVEGEPLAEKGHQRGFFSLRVVEEIDPHLALGPNGAQVARVIEQAHNLTEDQAREINAAGGAAWEAARTAAWGEAWEAAREASTINDARGAAWSAAREAAWEASGGAAWAAVVRDLISDEHYQVLAGRWESVMGPIFEDTEEDA